MNHPHKDEVITIIEHNARNGEAFDERTLSVLYKLSVADLFMLQTAFEQSWRFGHSAASEGIDSSGTVANTRP